MNNLNEEIFAPWRTRFLNVVEKSMLELNIKFTNYSIGQAANGETKKRYFDDSIQGIEFADELTVCSTIVNDCISSPIISGDVEEGKNAEIKFYRIGREERYDKSSGQRVDITVKRVSDLQILEIAKSRYEQRKHIEIDTFKTVFIEAKRAKRYPNSTLDNSQKSGAWTYNELKQDMSKKFRNPGLENRFLYILVWGVWDRINNKDCNPDFYLNKFLEDSQFEITEEKFKMVRWVPLSWNIIDSSLVPEETLEINKWCWILLAELTKTSEFTDLSVD